MKRRSLLKTACTLGASASVLQAFPLLAESTDNALLEMVHPELRDMAANLLNGNFNIPAISQLNLKQSREGLLATRKPPLKDVPVESRQIMGGKRQPDVSLWVINADKASRSDSRPAILHTHGGGYVMGSVQDSIQDLQRMSQQLDCVIVSVEYRLAPETTYLGSVEDNYAALKWLYNNAELLGVNADRIALMGESAGGGHAALLAIAARDRGEVPVAFQCLIYPMLDDRTGSSRSVPPHIGKLIWTKESNQFGWSSFLGVKAGSEHVPAGAVPARQENLKGLPPTFIGVGSLDLFSDESMEYAQQLNASGVPTEMLVVPGAFHGFDVLQNFGLHTCVGKEFNQAKIKALQKGLDIDQSQKCTKGLPAALLVMSEKLP